MAFFSKTNVMIKILHNLALFWIKNANFVAEYFQQKYLKIHNTGPRSGQAPKKECGKNGWEK
jgi:hypothetical protein